MRLRIGELLLKEKLINQKQLDEALAAARKNKKRLGKVLVEAGHLTDSQLVKALSRQLKVPLADVKNARYR